MLKRFLIATCVVALANVANAQLGLPNGPSADKNAEIQQLKAFPSAGAEAITLVDIGGNDTGGDDPVNDVVLNIDLGTGGMDTTVIGIGWDVVIDAFDPSWLSEPTIDFNGAITLRPGIADEAPGLGVPYSNPILDITNLDDGMGGSLDLSFVAPGGILTLTLLESFDDATVAPDGLWVNGSMLSIEHTFVPEPTGLALLAFAGLGLLGFRRS